jgi:hypothetical protein
MGRPRTAKEQWWHEGMHRHGKNALGGLMILIMLLAGAITLITR